MRDSTTRRTTVAVVARLTLHEYDADTDVFGVRFDDKPAAGDEIVSGGYYAGAIIAPVLDGLDCQARPGCPCDVCTVLRGILADVARNERR